MLESTVYAFELYPVHSGKPVKTFKQKVVGGEPGRLFSSVGLGKGWYIPVLRTKGEKL